jgi:hypothetical protein
MISSALGAIGILALGAVGWFATSFIARPLMHFIELRGEVIYRMVLYANVRARWHERPDDTMVANELSDEEDKRLDEAQDIFRELAARMRAFALNEPFAVRIVKRWYDPLEASTALLGVSNTLERTGGNRAKKQEALEKALGFRTTA